MTPVSTSISSESNQIGNLYNSHITIQIVCQTYQTDALSLIFTRRLHYGSAWSSDCYGSQCNFVSPQTRILGIADHIESDYHYPFE